MNTVQVLVCWACKKGGEDGPLVKIGKYDYVHKQCGGKAPDIGNQSIRTDQRMTQKEMKELSKKIKEEHDKTV